MAQKKHWKQCEVIYKNELWVTQERIGMICSIDE